MWTCGGVRGRVEAYVDVWRRTWTCGRVYVDVWRRMWVVWRVRVGVWTRMWTCGRVCGGCVDAFVKRVEATWIISNHAVYTAWSV